MSTYDSVNYGYLCPFSNSSRPYLDQCCLDYDQRLWTCVRNHKLQHNPDLRTENKVHIYKTMTYFLLLFLISISSACSSHQSVGLWEVHQGEYFANVANALGLEDFDVIENLNRNVDLNEIFHGETYTVSYRASVRPRHLRPPLTALLSYI
jgi:hypothetical protein